MANLDTARAATYPRRHDTPTGGALAIALLAGLLLTAAAPGSAAETEPRIIRVTGEAERRVAPDMATLQLQVIVDRSEVTGARAEADRVMEKALATLQRAGIDALDIDSMGVDIAPQYRWIQESREQELTGYRVTRSAEVRVLDLDGLGALLQRLSEVGINRMPAPVLGLQDEESVYRDVLAAAAVNARDRASALAAAVGESLGPVLSLRAERAAAPRPQPRIMERAMLAADAAPAADGAGYNAGHLSYSVVVEAAFAIAGTAPDLRAAGL